MAPNTNGNPTLDRVLIADDHEVNRELLEFVLEETYTVISAKDGEEALEMATQKPYPDIILLDIMMPKLNGYEVCQRLKENPVTRDIPVIFITAAVSQENETKGLEVGAIDYITKPITPTIVHARVKNHISYLKAQKRLVQAEKMEALGQVVAGVAHEINTPIGIMMTASSHLAEAVENLSKKIEAGEISPDILEKFLWLAGESSNLIANNAQRASDLVQSFKQISADQVSEVYRTIDIKDYIETIFASISPRLKQQRIETKIDCAPSLKIKTYPGAMAQIITNLAINSLDHAFTSDFQGEISISVEETADDTITIAYSDNGKGIENTIQSKVFEPFFTTGRSQGGTGLGLSIVHNLVTETLSGTIELSGQEGEGALFTIRFPKETPKHG